MLKKTKSATLGYRDYSHFDQMGTGKLKEILRLHALSPNDDADTQAILYIMEVVAHRENLQETVDVNLAWKSFQENYQPYASEFSLYDDEEEPPEDIEIDEAPPLRMTKPVRVRQRRIFRVAYIARALVLLVFATTITAVALGYDIWGGVAQWGSDTFGFRVVESVGLQSIQTDELDSSKQYDGLKASLKSHGITEQIAPTWFPERFELEDIKIFSTMTNKLSILATYVCEECYINIVVSLLYSEPYSNLEKDEGEVLIYESGGVDHYIMTNNGQNVAAWVNGNLECKITGDVSRDELIKIVDSIYER